MPEKTKTTNYFLQEYHSFRAIMCSTDYTVEQKLKAFQGLLFVYVGVETENKEQKDMIKTVMESLVVELNMRVGYELRTQMEAELVKITGNSLFMPEGDEEDNEWTDAINHVLG